MTDTVDPAAVDPTTGPEVVVLDNAPIAAIPPATPAEAAAVHAAELRAYLAGCEATGQPMRVDWAAAEDRWEPATVLAASSPAAPDRVLLQLDDASRFDDGQITASLAEVRPHQPCHGNGEDLEHPLGDGRFCLPEHRDLAGADR